MQGAFRLLPAMRYSARRLRRVRRAMFQPRLCHGCWELDHQPRLACRVGRRSRPGHSIEVNDTTPVVSREDLCRLGDSCTCISREISRLEDQTGCQTLDFQGEFSETELLRGRITRLRGSRKVLTGGCCPSVGSGFSALAKQKSRTGS